MSESMEALTTSHGSEAAGSGSGSPKVIGLLISILTLLLASSDRLGKTTQSQALRLHIEASDMWSDYRSKTVRHDILQTSLDSLKVHPAPNQTEVLTLVSGWRVELAKVDSDPDTYEGRKELLLKVKEIEVNRDLLYEKHHVYEFVSFLIHMAIVSASVTLLTSLVWFTLGSVVLGGLGATILLATYLQWWGILTFLFKG